MAIRVALAAALLTLAVGLSYTWGALAPFALSQTHWNTLEVALVFSATPGFYGFGMVIGGRLGDSQPPRRLLWAALALVATGYAVTFLRPQPATFILFYAGLSQGTGGGMAMACSLAAFRQTFPRRLGSAGGLLSSFFPLSSLLLVPIVTSLASRIGWVDGVRLTGTALVLLAALGLLQMPGIAAPRGEHHAAGRPFLSLVGRPLVWTGFLIELLATPLGAYSFVHLGPYAQTLGLSLAIASTAVVAAIAGNGLGRIVAGAASDRMPADRVILALLVCSLAAATALALASGTPLMLTGALLAGIGFGAPAGMLPRLAAQAAPEAPNTAYGLMFVGYTTGSFAGPLFGELLSRDAAGWLEMAAIPAAGLVVLLLRRLIAAPASPIIR